MTQQTRQELNQALRFLTSQKAKPLMFSFSSTSVWAEIHHLKVKWYIPLEYHNLYILQVYNTNKMIQIRKKISKMGTRRIITISKQDYDVFKVGDVVMIIKKNKKEEKEAI